MRQVEFENVHYNSRELIHASGKFLHMFAEYSDIPDTGHLTGVYAYLREIIEKKEPTNMKLNAKGITVFFSGFPMPKLQAEVPDIGEPKLVLKAPEPYFSIRQNNYELLPTERTHYMAVTQSIMEEMRDSYKVVLDNDPSRIIFPKEHYATSITREMGVLFDSSTLPQ